MDISIGLPGSVPGTPGATIPAWARAAEQAGFATLTTIDRIVYDSYEPLTTLAAAAAVTERIGLMTAILISPLHANTALLTKQAATVDRLSGHRLKLGLAVGARPDDFEVSGVPMAGRGTRLEAQIGEMARLWSGDADHPGLGAGPAPGAPDGPPIILGGHTPAAVDRAARLAQGWIAGGAGPEAFGHGARAFTERWRLHGRPGDPRRLALAYFALGDDAERIAEGYIREYYKSAGPFAEMAFRQAAVSDDGVRGLVKRFEAADCDELIFVPCSAELDQVARLAEITSAANAG
jgi:alkanesulfonate monooxygenase SsuD/methylene tetrahydromethanopterin reductase-like flavin-dependent oxidoreductase (luciferase family)